MSTIPHDEPVICNEEDTFRFNSPAGQSCDTYAGAWAQQAGGHLVNPQATSNCGYCQYSVGDQFAQSLSANFDFRWQSFGIFLSFCIFNIAATFALYWWFRIRGYGIGVGYTKSMLSKLFSRGKKQ